LEEQYGTLGRSEPPPNPDKKKKVPGAAIGYNYDDDGSSVVGPSLPVFGIGGSTKAGMKDGKSDADDKDKDDDDDDDDNDSNSDIDFGWFNFLILN